LGHTTRILDAKGLVFLLKKGRFGQTFFWRDMFEEWRHLQRIAIKWVKPMELLGEIKGEPLWIFINLLISSKLRLVRLVHYD